MINWLKKKWSYVLFAWGSAIEKISKGKEKGGRKRIDEAKEENRSEGMEARLINWKGWLLAHLGRAYFIQFFFQMEDSCVALGDVVTLLLVSTIFVGTAAFARDKVGALTVLEVARLITHMSFESVEATATQLGRTLGWILGELDTVARTPSCV